jgi:hypothetical protein
VGGNHICDICKNKLAWLSVTTENNCLVNGAKSDELFSESSSYVVYFDYVGTDDAIVTGWNIYDASGRLFASVTDNCYYAFTIGGKYHVAPIFGNG